jgi:hypothetical protein
MRCAGAVDHREKVNGMGNGDEVSMRWLSYCSGDLMRAAR